MVISNQSINQFKLLKICEIASSYYSKYYLEEDKVDEQFVNKKKAVMIFLSKYAHERQGAATAYPEIAQSVVEEKIDFSKKITENDAVQCWDAYKKIAKEKYNNLGLNELRNPMNVEGGLISQLASKQIGNLANYCSILINNNQILEAHNFMMSIRGIGTKIASFYLRDIAFLKGCDEKILNNVYLLQPIDTWIDQIGYILFGELSTKNLQKNIVRACNENGISSLKFNQGAWVIGSQFALNFETFKKILNNNDIFVKILDKSIYDMKRKARYLEEVKQSVKKF